MKHYLIRCSFVVVLLLSLLSVPVQAAESYSHLYISISDALINTKQDKETAANAALATFQEDWKRVTSSEKEAKAEVNDALDKAVNADSKEDRLTALTALSNALVALEKLENPVDEIAQREEFSTKFQPVMKDFEQALVTEDIDRIELAYKSFNIKWNKNERPVREQSIAMYGQIETQMAFIRISIAAEEPDLAVINLQYEELKSTIEDFVAGEETAEVIEGDYSLKTLIDLIDEANNQIDERDYKGAADTLREFIVIWPNVEIEISTRNSNLYTKIESDIPILVSELSKSEMDTEDIVKQLEKFKIDIQLIQQQTGYSYWDSALILLREGLEALLIILALVTFLKKSDQQQMTKWIYVGAFVGVALSAVAAILMSTVFHSATIDTNREMMEGYVGLVAAVMMIGVGIWLHNKSSVTSWNRYIEKQMGNAISKQSVFAMAAVSFLSVFREGAETIVFYAGIASKMETTQFVLGIVIALVILAIVAVIIFKATGKIPIHKFFFVATVFIYLLAFKIIGVSVHTLQLTSVLPTTVIDGLSVITSIGFYPTMETIIGQLALIILVVATTVYRRKS